MNDNLDERQGGLIVIGYVQSARGLRGEVKVKSLSNIEGRFDDLDNVYLESKDGSVVTHHVEYARLSGEVVVIKFKDINDRTLAESISGSYVLIDNENLAPLPSESYYIFDLIEMDVIDREGLHLGKVLCIEQYPANDVIVIRTADKDIMVPAIKEYITDIDKNNRRITVNLPEGLPEYPNG